jgi:asparagine synthase/glutamine amidotransferase-like protein
MPGLVCAVTAGERLSDPRGTLDAMLAPMANRPWYVRSEALTERAILGTASHDEEDGIAQRGDLTLAVNGEIFDEDLVDPARYPSASWALLERYEQRGLEGLFDVDGHFVIAIWNEAERELQVLHDRQGNSRAYYWQHGDSLYVSSQYQSLLWHPAFDTTICPKGLSAYLVLGCQLHDRTLFASVSALPGAHVLTWKEGQLSVRRYWDYHFRETEVTKSVAEYAEELVDIVRRCVKRSVGRRKPIIALSCGYDARFLAAVAAEMMDPSEIETFTLGSQESWDVAFSKNLARRLGTRHTTIPIPSSYFADYAPEFVRRSEAALLGHTCYPMAADKYLDERRDRVLLNGYLGDYYHSYRSKWKKRRSMDIDTFYETRLRSGGWWGIMGEELLVDLLRPEVFAEAEGWVIDKLTRFLKATPEGEMRCRQDHVQHATNFPNRFGRMHWIYNRESCRVRFPFGDLENNAFCMRLPLEIRQDATLPTYIFSQIYRNAGRAPYTDSGKPLNAGPLESKLYGAYGWLQFKAIPKLTFGKVAWRNRKTYVHYAHWLRSDNRQFVEDMILDGRYLEDLFQMDYVRSITSDVMEGRSDDFGRIYNLATFAIFRKYLCERRGKFDVD